MMIVKLRKFKSCLGSEIAPSFVIMAIQMCGFEHQYTRIYDGESVLNIALQTAAKKEWNPDTAYAMPVKLRGLGGTTYRILLLINNVTLEELVKQTRRLANMKAFL